MKLIEVTVGYQLTVFRSPWYHDQWLYDCHNEFFSEALKARQAERDREYHQRTSREMQASNDRRDAVRFLWWGSADDPWYRERTNGPMSQSPLLSCMNPERIQVIFAP